MPKTYNANNIIPIKALDKGIQKISKDLEVLHSQLVKIKEIGIIPKGGGASLKKLTDAQKELNKVQQEQTKINKEVARRELQIQKIREKSNVQIQKNKIVQQEANAEQKKAIKAQIVHDQALKKGIKSVQGMKKAISALNFERERLDLNTDKGRKKFERLTNQIKKTETQVKRYDAQIGRSQRNVGNYGTSIRNLVGAFGLVGGVTLFANALRDVGQVIVEFQKNVSTLGAIGGFATEELKTLTEQAKTLGAVTQFTASQILQLDTELAKLGFTAREIEDSVPGIQSLASATGVELAEAAKIAGATLNIFGLEASEAGRVADALALSTTKSGLDMEKLAVALPKVGKTAKIAGQTLEETVAQLGVLADNGIIASTSATGLRNIFLELSKKGITLEDAFNKINNSADKNKAAMELFGKESATVAVVLAETQTEVALLTDTLDDAGGAAEVMSKKMLDNIGGDLTILRSTWEGFILSIEDGEGVFGKAIRGIIQFVIFLVRNLKDIIIVAGAYVVGMKAAAIATALMSKNIKGAISGIKKLFAAFKANPFGLIIAGITAVILLLRKYENALDGTTRKQKQLNKVRKEAAGIISDEVTRIRLLVETARDENISKDNRLKAIKELNKISPKYLGNLTLETIKTDEATTAITEYLKVIEQKARANVAEQLLSDVNAKIAKKEIELRKLDTQAIRAGFKTRKELINAELGVLNTGGLIQLQTKKRINELFILQREAEEAKSIIKGLGFIDFGFLDEPETKTVTTKTGKGDKSKKDKVLKERIKLRLQQAKAIDDVIKELDRETDALFRNQNIDADRDKFLREGAAVRRDIALVDFEKRQAQNKQLFFSEKSTAEERKTFLKEQTNELFLFKTQKEIEYLEFVRSTIEDENSLRAKGLDSQIEVLKAGIAEFKAELTPEDSEKKPFSLWNALGLNDEDAQKANQILDQTLSTLSSYFDTQIQMYDELAKKSSDRVKDLEKELEEQEDRDSQGAASSIDRLKKELAAEKEKEKQAIAEKEKAGKRKKAIAITEAVIGTASAVVLALSSSGSIILGIILAAVAAAAGAVQIANIKSAKFATGTDYVQLGGNKPGVDTVPSMLTAGEGVIEKPINSKIPYKKGFKRWMIPAAAEMFLDGKNSFELKKNNSTFVNNKELESLMGENNQYLKEIAQKAEWTYGADGKVNGYIKNGQKISIR